MTEEQTQAYKGMNIQQRARFLLAQGVTASVALTMEDGAFYQAEAAGVAITPSGKHKTEQAAIDAGVQWLKRKAA